MSWNGRSLLKWHSQTIFPDVVIVTDASGSWGCGAFWDREWIQWRWPPEWLPLNIMAKELAPIVMACAVWGPRLSKMNVLFHCDNASVVVSINKGSARQDVVMHLLRSMWFFTAHYDMHVSAAHIQGAANCAADCISRGNMSSFFSMNPQAQPAPTRLPEPLLSILTPARPDWTSQTFQELFKATISRD